MKVLHVVDRNLLWNVSASAVLVVMDKIQAHAPKDGYEKLHHVSPAWSRRSEEHARFMLVEPREAEHQRKLP